jgi:hypothetical protein
VRVDIGPKTGIHDRPGVDAYYEDASQHVDLANPDESSIEVSVWFRNYQSNDLGFAMGVIATFLVQISDDADRAVHFVDVEIPYLEYRKAVKVDLVSVPKSRDVLVMVTSLVFHDFYDQRHEHSYAEEGTNALHGRLVFVANHEVMESSPEGRSRGTGVDYNVGAIR